MPPPISNPDDRGSCIMSSWSKTTKSLTNSLIGTSGQLLFALLAYAVADQLHIPYSLKFT